MLENLSQEQVWGLAFATLKYNEQNPENQLNEEGYLLKILKAACDSYYQDLLKYKQDLAVQAFLSADEQTQQQIFAILEVGDVVQ